MKTINENKTDPPWTIPKTPLDKFMLSRVKCFRRSLRKGNPIEQARGSCLKSFSLANGDVNNIRYVGAMTTLPVAIALEGCQGCPTGQAFMTSYEGRFGKFPDQIPSYGPVQAETYKAKLHERLTIPDNLFSVKTFWGYSI